MDDTHPGEVFRKATTAITEGDLEGWLAQCRDDIVLEFPYAPPGRPRRVEGKPAVAEYLLDVQAQIGFERITNLHVHQSVDPQTAVIEWSAKGHVKSNGAAYEMSYVVVLTVVDGLMAVYRDYWNPMKLVDALGKQ